MAIEETRTSYKGFNDLIDWKVIIIIALAAFLQVFLEIILPLLFLFPANPYLRVLLSSNLLAYAFLLAPALIFAAFYRLFPNQLFERISNVIVSTILGSVIGAWLGSIVAVSVVPIIFTNTRTSINAEGLLIFSVVDTATGFLAFAARYIVGEWDAKLKQAELTPTSPTPNSAFLIALIYIASGIMMLGILPVITFMQFLQFNPGTVSTLVIFVPTVVINCLLEVMIGYGVFRGRRWGWILALLGSALGVVSTLSLVYSLVITTAWVNSLGQINLLTLTYTIIVIFSLLLNLLLLALLLTKTNRIHCRIINPTTQTPFPNSREVHFS